MTASKPTQPLTDHLIDLAEGQQAQVQLIDRRAVRRVPYRAYVALLLVSPMGDRGKPVVCRARNISLHGISVTSRYMIYPGSVGAMQLLRSDGRVALVGVKVKASRYMGSMEHHTGMSFIPLPSGVAAEEFLDANGRMMLLDPMLRENLEAQDRARS